MTQKIHRADFLLSDKPQVKVWDTEEPEFDVTKNYSKNHAIVLEWLNSGKTYDVKQECVEELENLVRNYICMNDLDLTADMRVGFTLPEDVRERIEIGAYCENCDFPHMKVQSKHYPCDNCGEQVTGVAYAILKPALPKTEEGQNGIWKEALIEIMGIENPYVKLDILKSKYTITRK